MIRTINEGFGTIYDRFCKAEMIRRIQHDNSIKSVTEVDVGIPILHSGGLGLDSMLVSDEFSEVQFIYSLEENRQYAEKFFPKSATYCSFENFLKGSAKTTDLLFGNYIIEFVHDLEAFIKIVKDYKYVLFFESNHLNIGHALYKIVGRRFMIAPWVEYESVRKTTPYLAVKVLSELGIKNLVYGMIDFPFFAPASGVSPFKKARTELKSFCLQSLNPKQTAIIRAGMALERYLPQSMRRLFHMFYVLAVNRN